MKKIILAFSFFFHRQFWAFLCSPSSSVLNVLIVLRYLFNTLYKLLLLRGLIQPCEWLLLKCSSFRETIDSRQTITKRDIFSKHCVNFRKHNKKQGRLVFPFARTTSTEEELLFFTCFFVATWLPLKPTPWKGIVLLDFGLKILLYQKSKWNSYFLFDFDLYCFC